MERARTRLYGSALLAAVSVACTATHHGSTPATAKRPPTSAIAEMYPMKRTDVHGTFRFRKTDQGILVRGKIAGLVAGRYGFGIHEGRDCSPLDPKAIGPYLGSQRAKSAPPVGHLEDLLIENADKPEIFRMEPTLSLVGDDGIVGRTLVI